MEVLDLVDAEPALAHLIDPELPAIWAEVEYAALAELALTVTDVLERRLRLALEAADHGVSVAPQVAVRLARVYHWDAAEQERQITAYMQYVARHDAGL